MKHALRKFSAALCLAALLSGCQAGTPPEGPNLKDIEYLPVVEAADFAAIDFTPTARGALSQQRRELSDVGVFFFDRNTGLLMFNDWHADATYPLCAKINCAHTDAACNAWFDTSNGVCPSGLHSDGERLYYFTGGYPAACYVQDLDGENRRELFSLEATISGGYVFDGGSVYFVAQGLSSGEADTGSAVLSGREQVVRADLDGGTVETIPLTLPDPAGKITGLTLLGKYGDALCLFYTEVDRSLFSNFLQNQKRTYFLLDTRTGQMQGFLQDKQRAATMTGDTGGLRFGLRVYKDLDWDSVRTVVCGSATAEFYSGDVRFIDLEKRVEYRYAPAAGVPANLTVLDGKLFYDRLSADGQSAQTVWYDLAAKTEQPLPENMVDFHLYYETDNWFVGRFPSEEDPLPPYYRILKSDYYAGNDRFVEIGDIGM